MEMSPSKTGDPYILQIFLQIILLLNTLMTDVRIVQIA